MSKKHKTNDKREEGIQLLDQDISNLTELPTSRARLYYNRTRQQLEVEVSIGYGVAITKKIKIKKLAKSIKKLKA
jgi:hypothetical protein